MMHMLVGGFLFTIGSVVAVAFLRYFGPALFNFFREVRDEMDELEAKDRAKEV